MFGLKHTVTKKELLRKSHDYVVVMVLDAIQVHGEHIFQIYGPLILELEWIKLKIIYGVLTIPYYKDQSNSCYTF